MNSDLLKKLGIDPSSLSDKGCTASDEVHKICRWIMGNLEIAHEEYNTAVLDRDHILANEVMVVASTMYEIAEAIHSGQHLIEGSQLN